MDFEQELSEDEEDDLVSDMSDGEVESATICAVCMSARKTMVCVPCGHMTCYKCVNDLASNWRASSSPILNCPTCRQPIKLSFRVNN